MTDLGNYFENILFGRKCKAPLNKLNGRTFLLCFSRQFHFFCFLIYYEKSDQCGSIPKFRPCLSAHGYSFGSHFTRLIQTKVLTLVKLSLSVCMCVCFFLLLQIDSQHYVRSKMDQLGLSWDVDKK